MSSSTHEKRRASSGERDLRNVRKKSALGDNEENEREEEGREEDQVSVKDEADLSKNHVAEDEIVGYSEDENGLRVEHISEEECTFLYDEIFLRRSYLQEGITLSRGAGDVLDVGANIGLFSIFCHELLKPPSSSPSPHYDRIFAFEPVPRIFKVLQRNVSGRGGVLPRCFGLASSTKSEKFVYYPDAPGESSRHLDESREQRMLMGMTAEGEHATCEVRTLAEVIRQEEIQTIQLLKVDVEGDELEVLMGLQADDWKKIRQIVLEVCDRQFRLSRIQGSSLSKSFAIHKLPALLERNGFRTSFVQQKSEVTD
ncbi:hypothetical protein GUITHDRAFT_138324 [Guillardia theta CCMP2712]|uniref:Methyltransferase FkbM domain-containing protein n=1 Tax=Guillardia theta (strain CCMP2712) TaxID=905079 RepID=L1JDK7_GUITC|nr:hypothetical protein GUITHDRAFT_138324 [Guillardia theta CCMP2712]EKX46195.1 hypothetical protein GUITHDRAFT_138324 [Guillardia theta CCMP2712]|eukprot:XP_005833175.1 hypothetical protein GUITHDRAFT_138324 [Guillardia theta CCMP2712]